MAEEEHREDGIEAAAHRAGPPTSRQTARSIVVSHCYVWSRNEGSRWKPWCASGASGIRGEAAGAPQDVRYRHLKDSHGIIGARDARSVGQIRAARTVVQPTGRSTLSLRNTCLPNEFAMCCRYSAQRYVIVGACTVHLGPALGRASNRSRRRWPTNTWKCEGFSLFRLQSGRFAQQSTTPQTLNWDPCPSAYRQCRVMGPRRCSQFAKALRRAARSPRHWHGVRSPPSRDVPAEGVTRGCRGPGRRRAARSAPARWSWARPCSNWPPPRSSA